MVHLDLAIENQQLASRQRTHQLGGILSEQAGTPDFLATSANIIGQSIRPNLVSSTQSIIDRYNQLSDEKIRAREDAVKDPSDANLKRSNNVNQLFLDAQSDANGALEELADAANKAAEKTDLLVQAFVKARGDTQGLGSSVEGSSIQDLSLGLGSLTAFKQGGIGALNNTQFGAFKNLLGSAGDIDLGLGSPSSQILRDIAQEQGVQVVAASRSATNRTTFASEEAKYRKELADKEIAARKAGTDEGTLRSKQTELFNSQFDNAKLEKEFYTRQREILGKAGEGNPFTEIVNILKGWIGGVPVKFIADGKDSGGKTSVVMEVKPIQVNVALAAPDILKMVGPDLAASVVKKLTPAIADAFGVVGPEAKSKFLAGISTTSV